MVRAFGEIEMRIVTILAALAFAGAAQAAPFTCPTRPAKALDHITVFDGPPKDMASMRPEDGREIKGKLRQTWNVADIARLGRQVHVECGYTGGATLVVKPPKAVKVCAQDLQRLDNKGHYRLLSFSCR
jgi:hypothetical protein